MMEHPEKELCEQSAQGSFKPEQESVEKLAAKVESAGTEATQSQKKHVCDAYLGRSTTATTATLKDPKRPRSVKG